MAMDQRMNSSEYTAREVVMMGSMVVAGSLALIMCVMPAKGILQLASAPMVPTVLVHESERKKPVGAAVGAAVAVEAAAAEEEGGGGGGEVVVAMRRND